MTKVAKRSFVTFFFFFASSETPLQAGIDDILSEIPAVDFHGEELTEEVEVHVLAQAESDARKEDERMAARAVEQPRVDIDQGSGASGGLHDHFVLKRGEHLGRNVRKAEGTDTCKILSAGRVVKKGINSGICMYSGCSSDS